MQTRTLIDKIEIEPETGNIGVRMRKQVIGDAIDAQTGQPVVLANEYHRTMIEAGADPEAQMTAVNAHLIAMGYAAVKAEDLSVLTSALSPLAKLRAAKARDRRDEEPR